MNRLVCLVEGQGDFLAVPTLLRRLLPNDMPEFQHFQIDNQPLKVGQLEKLYKENYSEFRRYLKQALRTKSDCKAVLLLLDGDSKTSKGMICPKDISLEFSRIAIDEGAGKLFSFATVIVMREYESWFLASADDRLFQENGVEYDGKLDLNNLEQSPRGASERLNDMMPYSQYDKTIHQIEFTKAMNLETVASRMRSFRRMKSAASSLFQSLSSNQLNVTPT